MPQTQATFQAYFDGTFDGPEDPDITEGSLDHGVLSSHEDPDITVGEEDDEEDTEESVKETVPSPNTNQRITRSKTNNLPPPIDRFASNT